MSHFHNVHGVSSSSSAVGEADVPRQALRYNLQKYKRILNQPFSLPCYIYGDMEEIYLHYEAWSMRRLGDVLRGWSDI